MPRVTAGGGGRVFAPYQLRLVLGRSMSVTVLPAPRLELQARCVGCSSPCMCPPLAMGCMWSAVNDMGDFQSAV